MDVIKHRRTEGSDTRTITITYSRDDDDPSGMLSVFASSGQLGALLRKIGRSTEPDVAKDEREFELQMAMYREVFRIMGLGRRAALLAGRDQFLLSWRDLARLSDVPFPTVKRWILEERKSYAGRGMWFSPAGLQTDDDDPSGFVAQAARDERDRYDAADTGSTHNGEPVLRTSSSDGPN
ncbi:hypothetical protein [Micromonospora sp. CPCC 206061]|uniref:hypothetical protein n=1 Tax=Micromonospora sp. CPCC 206061 TaxID=3122410 RepID=UPI002FF180FB